MKPISTVVQEVSGEKKQQQRSSLTTALSNGLEKLKTVTTSSIQPVAPSSHPEKADSKKLKVGTRHQGESCVPTCSRGPRVGGRGAESWWWRRQNGVLPQRERNQVD